MNEPVGMSRDRFWEIVREAADYMIDKHEDLATKDGVEAADEMFADAIFASNRLVNSAKLLSENDQLHVSIQHCAFAVAALWLDFNLHGVADVIGTSHNTFGKQGRETE